MFQCGGGLTAKLSVLECVKKECQEEASVRDEVLDCLKFVGTIRYEVLLLKEQANFI